uniref:Uncharacterized protein n=1 Tax=Amphimedon queenslandica TaxID=400682 RepID=A0A1X7UQT8_AMPQE
MDARSIREKEIAYQMKSSPYCGFSSRITGNISYYNSLVRRDFSGVIALVLRNTICSVLSIYLSCFLRFPITLSLLGYGKTSMPYQKNAGGRNITKGLQRSSSVI